MFRYGNDNFYKEKIINFLGWGKRHTFAILGFSGFAISYAIRFNISIAIVAMVNSSGLISLNDSRSFQSESVCTLETELIPVDGVVVVPKPVEPHGEFNWNEEMQG